MELRRMEIGGIKEFFRIPGIYWKKEIDNFLMQFLFFNFNKYTEVGFKAARSQSLVK